VFIISRSTCKPLCTCRPTLRHGYTPIFLGPAVCRPAGTLPHMVKRRPQSFFLWGLQALWRFNDHRITIVRLTAVTPAKRGRLSFQPLLSTICHRPVRPILNCQHENAFKPRSEAPGHSQSCSPTRNPHAVIYVYRFVHEFRHRWTRLCVGTQVYQIQLNNAM